MEIVYENNRGDLANFYTYHTFRSISLLIITLIGLVFIAPKVWSTIDSGNLLIAKVLTTILVLIPFVLIMYGVTLLINIVSIYFRKHEGFLTQHRVEINEEGLIEETHINVTTHRWKGISKIKQNKKFIFIYIQQLGAHVIPKRAFRSRKQETEFFRLANQYWQTAKQADS